MIRVVGAAGAAFALLPATAAAHGSTLAPAWNLDPAIALPLAFALVLYAIGSRRSRRPPPWRRTLCWYAGAAALALALLSPLHAGGERSFALHMLEHELLMLVAAPLLVAAHVGPVLLAALPLRTRGRIAPAASRLIRAGHALARPLPATLLQAAVLWSWHAPALFDLALAGRGWHVAQHAAFFASACLFWSAMLGPRGARAPGVAIGCLFATAVVSGALGALMAFSRSPWYAGYRALGLDAFGLDPLRDQQVAGLLMWIPGGAVHAAAALLLLARVLRNGTRETAHVPAD